MKAKFISLILLSLAFAACKKDKIEPIKENIIEMVANPNFSKENFKTDFTIQFPANYDGVGMVGFEGNMFSKARVDDKIALDYSFCSPLYCNDFGSDLVNSNSTQISITDKNGQQILLTNRLNFGRNNSIEWIYFYNQSAQTIGKLYGKQGNVYQEALSINYENTLQNEVVDILKTIDKK